MKGYRYLEEDNSDESDSEKSSVEEEEEEDEEQQEEGGAERREDWGIDTGSQGSDSPRARRGGAIGRRRRQDDAYGQVGEREEYEG